MRARFLFTVCALTAFAAVLDYSSRVSVKGAAPPQGGSRASIEQNYGKLPMGFEANHGQTSADVRFLSRGRGYTLFLTGDEAVLALRDAAPRHGEPQAALGPRTRTGLHSPSSVLESQATSVLHLRLIGANTKMRTEGEGRLPGTSNYFIGQDPAKWRTNVPNFAKVKYGHVYPGIDLVYYGNQQQLEYDFVIAPDADPGAIRLEVVPEAHESFRRPQQPSPLRLDANGDLVIAAASGEVRFHKPVVYQTSAAQPFTREFVSARYTLAANHEVGFAVGSYDRTRPLVIDPVLSFATYLGGSYADIGIGIAVDSSGSAYIAGATYSANFPVTTGAYDTSCASCPSYWDAFLTKLSADGSSILYSTYIGGNMDDVASAVTVDKATGSAFITGFTDSGDFPTTANAFQKSNGSSGYNHVFVARLSPAGNSLLYSTLLRGDGQELANALAIDSAGSAYVTGVTSSDDFPTKNAFQGTFGGGSFCYIVECDDAFITKISPDGSSLVYSTYVGRTGTDVGYAIAVDSSGSAYVAGNTTSSDFPTHNPFQASLAGGFDGFVLKLTPSGSALVYSTFLGGSADEYPECLAIDSDGNVYVAGYTNSSNFPVAGAYQPGNAGGTDAFVTKLNASGSSLAFSTYLGGNGVDNALGISLDASRNVYVTGVTTSSNFPTVSPLQANSGGGADAFITEFPANGGTPLFSTYFGGSGDEENYSGAIVVDSSGNILVTGDTTSVNFPVVNALQPVFGGARDSFVVKISPSSVGSLSLSATSMSFGNQLILTASAAITSKITNVGSQAVTISSIGVSGGASFAQTDNCPVSPARLSGGANCTISVTFTPQSIGELKDQVVITSDAQGSPQTIDLSGTGVAPQATPSTNALVFGNQRKGTTSAAQTVTLVNNGGATLHLAASNALVVSGSNPPDYAVVSGTTCANGLAIAASGGSCVVRLTFSPSTTGMEGAALTFTDDSQGVAGSTQQVALMGTGVFPQATLSTPSLGFGNQPVNQTSAPMAVMLTNNGSDTLHLAATNAVAISGTNGADFAVVAGTTTCTNGAALSASGGFCVINLTFTPPSPGNRSATLIITDDASPTTQTVGLSGMGATGVVILSPATLDFGNQRTGTASSAKSLTLFNSGNSSIQLAAANAVTVNGANSIDFALAAGTTCTNALSLAPAPGPGNSCIINFTFTPGATGARSATVTVTDNASPGTQTASLKGTGVFPQASPSSPSINFQNQVVHTTSGAMAVTLTNGGSDVLHLDPSAAVAISGTNASDFAIASGSTCSNGSSIPANGGTCIVNLTFTPGAVNGRTATLTFTDDANPATQNVTLNGTGTNPQPAISTISPNTVTAGSADIMLMVNGSNFVSGAVVNFNGQVESAVFMSDTQLTATVAAADLSTGGVAMVTVTNPSPGGGTSNSVIFTINNPMPGALSLYPPSAMAGGLGFNLTVNGSNFVSTTSVTFNGKVEMTQYVSMSQLIASISAAEIAQAGVFNVIVINPAPGGGTSAPAAFTVNNPVPAINSLSPRSATAGGAAFTLTVNGSNFVTASVVNFNGSAKATTFIKSTQLTAALTAADIAAAGTSNVVVTNPAPGGGSSPASSFAVNNPVPAITSLMPASTLAGSAGLTLTVNGTNLVSTSVVNFNGAAKPTTFVSSGQLTALLAAGDLTSAGIENVSVMNPAPGGGTSANAQFTVNNPVPTLLSLSPNNTVAGSAGFTLIVNGSGFVGGAVVGFNGVAKPTGFVSSSQVTASIDSADVASAELAAVVVANPSPTVGPSAPLTFTVNNPAPTVTGLSPSHMPAGAAFMLTVNGTNFMSSSTVMFNGQKESTTYVSATQLNAFIPASHASGGGAMAVAVTNPAPGGGASTAVNEMLDSFTPTAPTASAVVTAGQAALFTIMVTPSANGFTNPITFSATGLPRGTTALFNPPALTPGSQASSTTLTVMTTGRGLAPPGRGNRQSPTTVPVGALSLAMGLLGLLLLLMVRRTAIVPQVAFSLRFGLVLLSLAIAATSCGGGNGIGNGRGGQGTPAGTSTITVTAASGSYTSTVNVSLTVQ